MSQSHEVETLLSKYFNQIQLDLNCIKIKKIPAKKNIYKPGDPITFIYLIVCGQLQLSYQDKDFILPAEIIVGDYEPDNHLSRRTSTLKTITTTQIAIIPFDWYYNLRQNVIAQQKFVVNSLGVEDKRARYLVSKYFKHKDMVRGEQLVSQHKQNKTDLILIQKGIFSIKKYIGVGVIQKYNIQIQKQFALIQVGEGEIVKQNITCESPKGKVFVCEHPFLINLSKHFQQLEQIIYDDKKKQSHLQRQQSIKNICFPKSQLFNSILPTIFQNSNSERKSTLKQMKKRKSADSLQNSKKIQFEKNHFLINRSQNNEIQSAPSSFNFSLIPFIKMRKPSIPQTTRTPQKRILQNFLKQRMENPQLKIKPTQKSKKAYTEQSAKKQTIGYKIPQIFDSKFKKKMFLKANNPFHHYKSKSLSLAEHFNEIDKYFVKDQIVRKSSTVTQHKKSKILQIGCQKQKQRQRQVLG